LGDGIFIFNVPLSFDGKALNYQKLNLSIVNTRSAWDVGNPLTVPVMREASRQAVSALVLHNTMTHQLCDYRDRISPITSHVRGRCGMCLPAAAEQRRLAE
jgi:hypothetical protein